MSNARQIVFFKFGSFSYVNDRVETLLQNNFPEFEVTSFDVARDILAKTGISSLSLRVRSILPRLETFLRGRHGQWDFVFREAKAWALLEEWVRRHLDPGKVRFVFQTQSLFDASHPDIPFFLYTDHTHAAHKRHPGGGAPAAVGRGWIELERALYFKADAIFTLSHFCATSVIEDYAVDAGKVVVASTGINIDFPPAPVVKKSGPPMILFVGGDWKTKGGPDMLAAFALVRAAVPECELWLVGSRPPELPDGVRYFGKVSREAMAEFFSSANVLCVPSAIERASMVALDAAAYGLPVISTIHGAGSERLQDGVTGYLVEPRDSRTFSSMILRLIGAPDLAKTMGLAGRRMVEENFTWNAVGAKICGRIREVLPPA